LVDGSQQDERDELRMERENITYNMHLSKFLEEETIVTTMGNATLLWPYNSQRE
jgi:hypothetical protein